MTACCVLALLLAAGEEALTQYRNGLEAYNRRDHAVAAAALAAFLSEPGGSDSQRREATAALGLSYHFLGDHARAVPLLEQAGRWHPGHSEFSRALATSYLRINDASGARRAFARLFGVPPGSAQAYLLAARFMIGEHMERMAQAELERAAALEPSLPQVHYFLGELAIFRGEHDSAIAELRREIALNPAFAMAHYRLGDAFTRKSQWSDAIAPLQKAIWLNPEFSSPYILLGRVYDQTGQPAFAEAMLAKAVAMDPNNSAARYMLGTILRKAGREIEARDQFEAWRRLKR